MDPKEIMQWTIDNAELVAAFIGSLTPVIIACYTLYLKVKAEREAVLILAHSLEKAHVTAKMSKKKDEEIGIKKAKNHVAYAEERAPAPVKRALERAYSDARRIFSTE